MAENDWANVLRTVGADFGPADLDIGQQAVEVKVAFTEGNAPGLYLGQFQHVVDQLEEGVCRTQYLLNVVVLV